MALYYQQSTSGASGHQPLRLVTRGTKYDVWQTVFTPTDIAVYTYDFQVKHGKNLRWYGDSPAAENTAGQAYRGTPDQSFHLTSYVPTFKAPSWAEDAIYYQIFPDRFYNGDPSNDHSLMSRPNGKADPVFDPNESDPPQGESQFYGGDLQGIDDKLPYLKDLGVNTLYLNPIFLSPTSHKYDTSDYYTIDPHFGTIQTLRRLLQDAHSSGMRVILDGVFNHTGSDSVYFNEYNRFPDVGAYQSQTSSYYSYYSFSSWPSVYASFPDAPNMPQLQENDAVKDFIFRRPDSVAQHWLSVGTDGWRLDAATFKSHTWWQGFRQALKAKYPEDVLVCECDLAPIDAISYLMGNEFDGDMNYRFRDTILRFFARGRGSQGGFAAGATGFFNQMLAMDQEYPLPAIYSSMNVVDSHDLSRILTSLGGSKSELRLVATFQATWLGAPAIYYGDEAGMQDVSSPDPSYISRNFYDWAHADTSLQSYYRTVLHIRTQNRALRDGSITPLVLNDKQRIVSFLRRDSSESVAVAINDDAIAHTVKMKLAGLKDGTVFRDGISGAKYTVAGGAVRVTLRGQSAAILVPPPAS